MPFLPKDYKAPASSGDFMSKFQDGENRVRILSEAVIGWEGWKDNKPFRREGVEQNIEPDEVDTDSKYGKPKPKINHFWGFLVYDYASKMIRIMTVTQKSVMKKIENLVDDSDWGDPQKYDISVKKTKKGERTSYDVTAYPPKPLAKEVKAAFDATELDHQILFAEQGEEEDDGFGSHGK